MAFIDYGFSMNRIDMRELECFVAVANHLSFSKAARQLHLSQPPVTRYVQALEEQLGIKMFARNAHAVSLTDAGVIFLEDVKCILSRLDHATEAIRRVRQGETSRLRVAFFGALMDLKLIRLIQRFRKDHPVCQVELTDMVPSVQLSALQAGELDGGFIGIKPSKPSKGVAFLDWSQDPLLLVLPKKHPLARIGKIGWQHLHGLPWVMVSGCDAVAFRQEFCKILESRTIAIQIVQESDRLTAVLTMVAAGVGVTVVPKSLEHLVPSGIVIRQLHHPEAFLQYVFAYRTAQDSSAFQKFLPLLKKWV
jgi:DNA-binding transcriptional LysR family regulator